MTLLFRSAHPIKRRSSPLLAHPLVRHWLRNRRSSGDLASIAGLTLLEALVAMIIIGVIISVITPPVFIAVATRVYQRKTEQALNIAQQEIDSVRRTVSSGDYKSDLTLANAYTKVLPPTVPNGTTMKNYAAPTAICTPTPGLPYCSSAPLPTTALVRDESAGGVGGSTDSSSVFYVQVFRTEGSRLKPNDVLPGAFVMAVRVYEEEPGAGKNLGTDQAPLTFTTGTANRKGSTAQPLAVLYTEVTRGDSGKESLNSIKTYLPPTAP
jgi:type II secretory pathway pseudopilin PulG